MFQEGKTSRRNLVSCKLLKNAFLFLLLHYVPMIQIDLKTTELTHVTKCIHSLLNLFNCSVVTVL